MCVQQKAAEDNNKPVLDGGSGVFTATHADHDDGEEEEEAGHGEAHAVHRLVAHDDLTVHLVLHSRNAAPTHTEARDLDTGRRRQGGEGSEAVATIQPDVDRLPRPALQAHLLQVVLHPRQDHDDRHQRSQQQQEGEGQAAHRGVVRRRAAR